MQKPILSVFDLEADYVQAFADYLNKKHQVSFDVHAFTSGESLAEFAGKHRIELLIVSAGAFSREIRAIDTGKTVVLSDGSEVPEGYDCVYKYQAISHVLQEVMAVYSDAEKKHAVSPVLKNKALIYGVYSPLGRCGKTSFALALGQELARKSPTLYLNLEGCSGFEGLTGQTFSRCLSDLLYYARQGDEGFIHRVNVMIHTVERLDYIPPVRMEDDIRQAQWKDLEYLISELTRHSAYEILVIDFGRDLQDPWPLMETCAAIFLPVLEDIVSQCKLAQFERTAEENFALTAERFVRVKVPEPRSYLPADNYISQLLWNEVGDCARKQLSQLKA